MSLPTLPSPIRLAVALALVLSGALVAVPAAGARLVMHRCVSYSPVLCGTLTVPLDRSGAVAGTVRLHVERLASEAPTEPPLFFLSGGPGQSSDDAMDPLSSLLAPALRHRDLVLFDQRGTGLSGALDCPALERADPDRPGGAPAACAAALGARRSLYTTADSVADIDAVRAALGYNRLALYGVSYGTKVALAYARAYPQRLERLVIDSVVTPDGPDPLTRSSFQTMPRMLRELCGGACASFTRDPGADLSALVARLSRADLTGVVYGPGGRGQSAHLNRLKLFETILGGDFDPTLRAELPADVHAALSGDSAPILRLVARALPPVTGEPQPEEFSATLFTATTCEELSFPWAPSATPAQRVAQTQLLVDSMPASVFAPFDAGAALSSQLLTLCGTWPGAGERFVPASGPLPDVPALVLSGRQDVRTPLEDARSVAAQLPHARFFTVPNVGHSVVGTDESGCAARLVARFLEGLSTGGCRGPGRQFPIAQVPPRSVSVLADVPGITGARGRAARAALLTAQDVLTQASLVPADAGGGLRGGRWGFTVAGLRLDRVVYVPGVKVSGLLNVFNATGQLRLTGAAGSGVLDIGHGRITGTLSGRRVHGRARLLVPGLGQGAGATGLTPAPPRGPWPVT